MMSLEKELYIDIKYFCMCQENFSFILNSFVSNSIFYGKFFNCFKSKFLIQETYFFHGGAKHFLKKI